MYDGGSYEHDLSCTQYEVVGVRDENEPPPSARKRGGRGGEQQRRKILGRKPPTPSPIRKRLRSLPVRGYTPRKPEASPVGGAHKEDDPLSPIEPEPAPTLDASTAAASAASTDAAPASFVATMPAPRTPARSEVEDTNATHGDCGKLSRDRALLSAKRALAVAVAARAARSWPAEASPTAVGTPCGSGAAAQKLVEKLSRSVGKRVFSAKRSPSFRLVQLSSPQRAPLPPSLEAAEASDWGAELKGCISAAEDKVTTSTVTATSPLVRIRRTPGRAACKITRNALATRK
jgi:hypothetical protein